MSEAECQRYAAAVARMMRNVDGEPESSPFFQLAAYHGWPGKGTERNYSYCEHRQETFPGWHRAYLVAFEEAFQEADRALGNDGRIGLPYWDIIGQPELFGQVFPSILRTAFPNGVETVRGFLRDPSESTSDGPRQQRQRQALWDVGYQMIDDETLKAAVERERLGAKARETLWVGQHYRAASTFGSSNQDSIESPHDMIHVLCGYPMRSLMHAAFHPAFWLHHCNIDRLYEAYLAHNRSARTQFENNQDRGRFTNKRRGRRDRFHEWLEPFYLPKLDGGEAATAKFLPEHTFDTAALGYVYDVLQTRPNQALTAPPIVAVSAAIDVNVLPTGYTLFVFVYPKSDESATPPLGPGLAALLPHPNLGGIGALFTGRADVCAECQNSEPFDLRVDVTATLTRLGLTADGARVATVVETAEHEWLPVADTPIPPPVLRGGRAQPTRPRFDQHDSHEDAADRPNFTPGSTVTYVVEAGPGELPRGKLLHEISQMFTCWAGPTASGLTFKRLPLARADEANLVIGWEDHSETNLDKFDGPGGKLAEASSTSILLDASERWMLHGAGWSRYCRTPVEPGRGPAFYVAPVILHEIGHVLGLSHSHRSGDVMASLYSADRVVLSENDKARVRAAYGVPTPGGGTSEQPPARYFEEHKQELEFDLSAAINDAIALRAPRPLRHVADKLMEADEKRQ